MPGREECEVALLTCQVAACAVAWVFPLALFFGWLLARRRFPLRSLVETLLLLPLVLPPSALGFLLLWLLSEQSPCGRLLGAFGLEPLFTWQAASLASGVIAFPLMLRFCQAGFQSVDRRLESMARTLGASPFRVFAAVTLPLARRGLLAALVIGFARAISEFGATLIVAGNIPGRTRTLPLAIYSSLLTGQDALALRFAALSLALALLALILLRRLEPAAEGER